MKRSILPGVSPARPALVTTLVLAMITLMMSCFPGMAASQGPQIIAASPGQTVTYQGQGYPGGTVSLEAMATVSAGVTNNHYILNMNGVNIPGGSRFSVSASPVSTLAVTGSPSWAGGLGYSLQGSVSGGTGSASMSNVPGGTYNIVVSGIANGSGSVSVTVHAYQTQAVGSDGSFSASLSTAGLPAAVYSIRQDGRQVALVYLGVQAPATPTPEATPTPVPTPTETPNSTITPTPTAAPTAVISVSPTPTPQPSGGSFLGIQLPSLFGNPTATAQPSTNANGSVTPIATDVPQSGGGSSLINTVLIMLIAIVLGALIGYVVVFKVFKW